jgi:hypothetical protein
MHELSSVRGIGSKATAEDARFVKFFNVIQKKANQIGCIFFADSGEGRDVIMDEMDGEDVSGWLIPFADADAFEKQWLIGNDFIADRFWVSFTFARWEITPNGLEINFA